MVERMFATERHALELEVPLSMEQAGTKTTTESPDVRDEQNGKFGEGRERRRHTHSQSLNGFSDASKKNGEGHFLVEEVASGVRTCVSSGAPPSSGGGGEFDLDEALSCDDGSGVKGRDVARDGRVQSWRRQQQEQEGPRRQEPATSATGPSSITATVIEGNRFCRHCTAAAGDAAIATLLLATASFFIWRMRTRQRAEVKQQPRRGVLKKNGKQSKKADHQGNSAAAAATPPLTAVAPTKDTEECLPISNHCGIADGGREHQYQQKLLVATAQTSKAGVSSIVWSHPPVCCPVAGGETMRGADGSDGRDVGGIAGDPPCSARADAASDRSSRPPKIHVSSKFIPRAIESTGIGCAAPAYPFVIEEGQNEDYFDDDQDLRDGISIATATTSNSTVTNGDSHHGDRRGGEEGKRTRKNRGEDMRRPRHVILTTSLSALIQQVLEVFPDAKPQNVKNLLHLYNYNVDAVLADLAEQSKDGAVYCEPVCHDNNGKSSSNSKNKATSIAGRVRKIGMIKKKKKKESSLEHAVAGGNDAGGVLLLRRQHQEERDPSTAAETKWRYDYTSTASFQPTSSYVKQATEQIRFDFPFLDGTAVARLLGQWNDHYAVAHDRIFQALKGQEAGDEQMDEVRYHQVLRGMQRGAESLDDDQIARLENLLPAQWKGAKKGGVVAATSRGGQSTKGPRRKKGKKSIPRVTDEVLQEEVQYVKQKLVSWKGRVEKRLCSVFRNEASRQAGTAVECSCCYDEYAIDEMVSCKDEGHLFCVDCLKRFAENQIYGVGNLGIDPATKQPALELQCFHGTACTSAFPRECLVKALSLQTLQKYDEMQFQLSVDIAGLDDICTCPKCGFKVSVPKTESTFRCPMEDCQHRSCRHCGGEPHAHVRCDEVEKPNETRSRLSMEEAITAAKIRNCPKCKRGFIKSDGCNKIRCGCGTHVCYICRAAIKDYKHFCQTPHCRHEYCHKCPLWTSPEQDDEMAMREAVENMKDSSQDLEDGSPAYAKERKPKGTVHIDLGEMFRDHVKSR